MHLWPQLALCLILLAAQATAATAQRSLQFPDRSLGDVSTRPASHAGFGHELFGANIYEGWSPLAPARGRVEIPDNHVVRLELAHEAAPDLAALDELPADAVDALSASYLPVDDAAVKRLSRLTALRSLDLGGTKITSDAAPSIGQLAQLQYLNLNSTAVDDRAMPALAALPRLEVLSLYKTGVTDAGLKTLAGSPSLKAVYVGYTPITDAGVAELCKLSDLRALNLLAGNPKFRGDEPVPAITDAVVDAFGRCPSLEYLDLTGAELTDAGLARLAASAPNLRGLVLDYTKVTPQGFAHLAGFTKLEKFRLQGVPMDDAAARQLASLKDLREVTGDTNFSDAGVKALSALPKLEAISLDGHRVTDDAMTTLAGMRSLKRLSLQHTAVTDEGFARLAGAPSIERVHLTGNKLTTRAIETLATMPRLRQVGLMDVDPRLDGEPAWTGLQRLSSLEDELWFCYCPSLSADDYQKLADFTRLKRLRIEGGFERSGMRPTTDADLQHLARLQQLQWLDLTSTVITDEGLETIAALPALRSLHISCLATDAGLEKLAAAPGIEHLTIGSPNITDQGLERLKAANPRLATARREPFRLNAREVSRSASDRFWRNGLVEERGELNALEAKPAPTLRATRWFNAAEDAALEKFRGKVVLVEFWGTWCGPCLAQLPEIRRLHDQYADEGLVVIGVHSTHGADKAEAFIASNKLPWPIAIDDADASKAAYHVPGWPTCYLIDRQGVLRMAGIFDGDREAAIQALLAETL